MKKVNVLNLRLVAALTAALFLVTSCKKGQDDDGDGFPPAAADYSQGVLITNEGPFQNGTGTITHINRTSGEATTQLFKTVNGRSLGNIVQSAARVGDNTYIVVNNAKKIEVVNSRTFKSVAQITGLESPRYVVASASKVYISEIVAFGSNGRVSVVDKATNKVTSTIEVGLQPEQMVIADGSVFVINKGESSVSKIDIATDKVIETITVGDRPDGIVNDGSGKLWILCGGVPSWDGTPSAGSLVSIDVATSATNFINFLSEENHPSKLINDGNNNLYYVYKSQLFKHAAGADKLDTTTVIVDKSFYGIGFDKTNNVLYGSDAVDFSSNGYVFRYSYPGFAKKDSIKVGIIPGNFVF